MKPTSIIFLVVSVLLIIGGIVTCSVAKDVAVTDGYILFHDSDGGGTYVRQDFDATDINKIELVFTDAEINIYGGAEESYIEFFNFRDGLYRLSTSGNTLSLDEVPNLKSLLSFKGGFSFSGMRYFLRFGNAQLGPKKVNVYIGADSALKVITLSGDSCTVNAETVGIQADMDIAMDKSVTLIARDIRTASALSISAPTITLDMEDCSLNEFLLQGNTLDASLDRFYFAILDGNFNTGNLSVQVPASLSQYNLDVQGSGGTFTLNGEKQSLPYKTDANTSSRPGKIHIVGGRATISLTVFE